MKQIQPRSKNLVAWLLVIPTVAWFYIGLFITMSLWYPVGLPASEWQAHLMHFSLIYLMWLIVFFSYRLFDWDTLRIGRGFLGRLLVSLFICLVIAVVYFYFQPQLLITPRRFLLVHLLVTGFGLAAWFTLIRRAANLVPRRKVFAHPAAGAVDDIQQLIDSHQYLGLEYGGVLDSENLQSTGAMVVIPRSSEINPEVSRNLFALRRNQGVRFVEFYELYENLTRTVHLAVLNELWFLNSVEYGSHRMFDVVKRIIDIVFGLLGAVIFVVTFPVIALLIKATSRGPALFVQNRVGQFGRPFALYKYRTMRTGEQNDIWTSPKDSRITAVGRFLRASRLDELPQCINILKGDMSIVGPRPEQVGIVEEMREQIPYYDERHIVKPGLSGWAQLHVYAATLEETQNKLQYDLYYIKHRSLMFDFEIIAKTAYNILTFRGR